MFSQCLGPRSKTWPQIASLCIGVAGKIAIPIMKTIKLQGPQTIKMRQTHRSLRSFSRKSQKKRTIIKFVEVSYLELCPRGYGAFNFSLGHATPKNHPKGLSTSSSCRGRPRSAPAPLLPSSSQQAVIVVYCWDWHELAFFGFVMFET